MASYIVYSREGNLRPAEVTLNVPFSRRQARMAIAQQIMPGERYAGPVMNWALGPMTETDARELLAARENPFIDDTMVHPSIPLTPGREATLSAATTNLLPETLFKPIEWPSGIMTVEKGTYRDYSAGGKADYSYYYEYRNDVTRNVELFTLTGEFLSQFDCDAYSESGIFAKVLKMTGAERSGPVLGLEPREYFELLIEINTIAKLQGMVVWPASMFLVGVLQQTNNWHGGKYVLTGTEYEENDEAHSASYGSGGDIQLSSGGKNYREEFEDVDIEGEANRDPYGYRKYVVHNMEDPWGYMNVPNFNAFDFQKYGQSALVEVRPFIETYRNPPYKHSKTILSCGGTNKTVPYKAWDGSDRKYPTLQELMRRDPQSSPKALQGYYGSYGTLVRNK